MGEKEGERARSAEPDESSSRKSPRLEPHQGSARDDGASYPDKTPSPPELTGTASSPEGSDLTELAVSSDTSSDQCRHFSVNGEEMELLLTKIESIKCSGLGNLPCDSCMFESAGVGEVDPHKQQQQLTMVCTHCDQCMCAGVASREDQPQPQGHARTHACENEHWVALWLDKPRIGYCFFCDTAVYVHTSGSGADSEGGSSVNYESSMSQDEEPAAAADGHAHASGSDTDGAGYAIRGIPNVANTCYMNALVQCLLALDKLQTVMLGPNAPTASVGTALKELFLQTRASNGAREKLLNPRNLLKSIRALDPKYNGCNMHDSHELLCSLRKWLNEEELKRSPNAQDCVPGAIVTTVVDSIFQGELFTTRTSKCCQHETVHHAPFYELSLPLASKKHPNKSIPSRQRTHRSRQKNPAVKQLFLAFEDHYSEKDQTITDGGDPGIVLTEEKSVVMEKSLEPLGVDTSEAEQIHQRKNVVHSPSLTHKDVGSLPELIEVPVKSVAVLPDSIFTVKVEEMHKPTADANIPEITVPPPPVSPVRRKNASVASDCDLEETDIASQSNKSEADIEAKENMSTVQIVREVCIEAKENTSTVEVTKEDKRKDLMCNFAYDENTEDSKFLASIKDCLELFFKEEVIERRCEKCLKVPQQSSTTGSTHGHNSEYADQKVTISKLPPVLTVQLMRFNSDKDNDKQVKIKRHVSFEENLDVQQFMEPSSQDKDNSSYRIVGIIEHIGDSLNSGHYVAYVRASRVGSNKQLISGSSSWFRADDGNIKQVSLEEVLQCEAFVLFYERVEG